jgi:hypothetical protein
MSAASTPLFGKKWKLTVDGPANSVTQTQQKLVISSDDQPQPLRVTFDVKTIWYVWYWEADIRIYNLSEDSTQWLLSQAGTSSSPSGAAPGQPSGTQAPPIQQGMTVTLEAGYQNPGQYGIIWQGQVLQPLFSRENQTDFVVTLHCVVGLNQDARNFINQTYPPNIDPLAMVQQMAAQCFHPVPVSKIAPSLSGKGLSYPKAVFGNFGTRVDEIVRSRNMQRWLDGRGFNVGDLNKEFPSAAKYTFTPANTAPIAGSVSSIIGTPVQTQFGVNLRLLLNPNVVVSNPAMAIAINNTVVQQLQRQIGDITSIGILSQSGTYAVVAARYIGDTRGEDWYTDVTGWLGQGYIAALAATLGGGGDQGAYFNK